jgi:RNA polymerase sigma-70 factor, ECF subfamily
VSAEAGNLLEHLFRRQAGRMVAHLARRFGPSHLDLAEEAVQGAMLRALQTWPYQGVPEHPEGWLFRVAQNSAIDTLRRDRRFRDDSFEGDLDPIAAELAHPNTGAPAGEPGDPDFEEQLRDDELRMIFMCSHPELSRAASVALSLKIAGGLSVREIARAFLADVPTIEQRIVRAKRQIRERGLTLAMPHGAELQARLDSVMEVIYFIFNEGYAAHEGEELIRRDLCFEALRLGQLVASSSISGPHVHALVAVMALQAARLPARVDKAGDLILLEDQDRRQWDPHLIALGFHHFELSMSGDEVSEYHVQAAIAATHARANAVQAIDWPMILQLYDQLLAINPSPVVALNRAVAVAKVHGAAQGLAAIEPLENDAKLRDYYLLLAVRGHLLLELGRSVEAAACFRAALDLRCSEPERRFLRRKLAEAEGGLQERKPSHE